MQIRRGLGYVALAGVLPFAASTVDGQPPDEPSRTEAAAESERPAGDEAAAGGEPDANEQRQAPRTDGDASPNADVVVMPSAHRRLSMLIGAPVVDSEGTEIGEIEELILTGEGSLDAVLAIGGIAGLGERLVLVRLDELDVSVTGSGQEDGERQYGAALRDVTGEQLADSRPEFRYHAE